MYLSHGQIYYTIFTFFSVVATEKKMKVKDQWHPYFFLRFSNKFLTMTLLFFPLHSILDSLDFASGW